MDNDLRKKNSSFILKMIGALTFGLISFFGIILVLLLAFDGTNLLLRGSILVYFPLIVTGVFLLSKKYEVINLIYRGILINFFLFLPSAFLVALMAESSDKDGSKIFIVVAFTSLLLLTSLSISGLVVLFGRENNDKLSLNSKLQKNIFVVLFGCSVLVSLICVIPSRI